MKATAEDFIDARITEREVLTGIHLNAVKVLFGIRNHSVAITLGR